jgi:predicted HTH domain antitoxin
MICIEIPDELAAELRLPPNQLEILLKRELAVHLVRESICTPAQGARLAQMDRLVFERLLGERKIPWPGGIEDVLKDAETLEML